MKKITSVLLVISIIVSLLTCVSGFSVVADENTTEFDGGDGSTSNPYLVSTVDHLNNVRNHPGASYKMVNDIDLTEATASGGLYDNGGYGWLPIGNFAGTFDGNGYRIIGLRMVPNTNFHKTRYFGLFSSIKNGTVKNLGMCNGEIHSYFPDWAHFGFIAGDVRDSKIENCYNTGNINLTGLHSTSNGNEQSMAGGIVGYSWGTIISKCYNTGSISAKCDKDVNGFSGDHYSYVSGICGQSGSNYSTKTTINDCFNTGNLYATQEKSLYGSVYGGSWGIGSIAVVYTSYNIGTALYSIASAASQPTYCYHKSGCADDGGSTPLTESQLRKKQFYGGFDFENTWTIIEDSAYPYPQLQGNIYNNEDFVTSLTVSTVPSKVTYLEGKDNLNTSGGVLTVEYKDSTSETVDIEKSRVTGFDNTKVGTQTLTVHFGRHTATYDVTVVPKTLSGISVSQAPTKTDYIEAFETLDLTGGKLTLHYDNDTTEEIPLSNALVIGFENTVVGEKTLTATYKDFTATFTVNVVAKSVASIDIYKTPDKLEYLEAKDLLDLTGGKMTVHYNNGTSEVKDLSEATVTGFNNATVGEQELTVNYGGCQTTFVVDIIEKSVSEILVSTLPDKTNYIELLEQLDVTGGKLKLIYDNGFAETIDLTLDMVVGFDNATVGKNTVTVYYEGLSTTFDVNITEKSIVKIEMDTYPDKLTYLESKDTLDTTGGVIQVIYNNGTEDKVELTDNMVSGFSNSTVGTKTLTVFYLGKTTTFDVEIIEKTLTGIEISSTPAKLTYLEGKETLSVVGGRIKLIYDNDTTKTVTMTSSMVVGFDNTEVGTQTLTVIYENFTAEYEIEIIAKSVSSIYIDTKPAKLTFIEGTEGLVTTGGKLHVNYNNGTSEKTDISPAMVSGFNNMTAGKQTLTVTYGEKTATYTVEIKHNYVSKIVPPTCTENGYTEHECTVCKDKYTDNEISAPGHSWKTTWSKDDGYHWHTCENCNEIKDKEAHTFGEWTVTNEATDTKTGLQKHTCTVCGFEESEEIPVTVIKGDLNGDGEITDQDAVYLLFHTFFPEDYPVSGNVDYDSNGEITDQDAVYLLFHTFFPEDYPI